MSKKGYSMETNLTLINNKIDIGNFTTNTSVCYLRLYIRDNKCLIITHPLYEDIKNNKLIFLSSPFDVVNKVIDFLIINNLIKVKKTPFFNILKKNFLKKELIKHFKKNLMFIFIQKENKESKREYVEIKFNNSLTETFWSFKSFDKLDLPLEQKNILNFQEEELYIIENKLF